MSIDYEHGRYIGCISNTKLTKLKTKYSLTSLNTDNSNNYRSACITSCNNKNADYLEITYDKENNKNICKCLTLSKKKYASKFEADVADNSNKCNNGFKSPEWTYKSGNPFLIKDTDIENRIIFKLKNPSIIDSENSAKTIENPPYQPIGYYNIDNADEDNKIDSFSYLIGDNGNKVDAKLIKSPGISIQESTSNTNIMTAFLIAQQNDNELVIVYTGTQSSNPVIYMGKINSMMKDCNVDIIKGYINPFFAQLTDKPRDSNNQYKVYLRPDLNLDDFISLNKNCSEKIQAQYNQLKQNYFNTIRFNSNVLNTKSKKLSSKNNILSSIYKDLNMIEHYDNSISDEQTKENIDSYFETQQQNLQQKSSNIAAEYKEELNKLNSTSSDNNQYANVISNYADSQDDTIKSNYSNLQNINQKLYKLNSNIDTTTEKLKYNKNIIRILRIFLLCLFILMLVMIGYYGVRNAYKNKSKNVSPQQIQ